MKFMIMTDMEGVAGILNHDDWVIPSGRFYDKGMRLLTEEVNAAVDGLYAGGAEEIVVVDGHGAGGLDPELLDERAQLQRGRLHTGWPCGLDASFAGICWVGQHAKAGTDYSHITHTQSFHYIDIAVNGISIGEYGQLALCAMELGVPAILACGEKALTIEAQALTPGVVTVAVKEGLLPDTFDDLDAQSYGRAKLSARHLAPKRARQLIREGAQRAAVKVREEPDSFGYPDIRPPFVCVTRFRADGDAPPHDHRTEHPDSFIGLMNAR